MMLIRVILVVIIALSTVQQVDAWGFWGHKRINRVAVFTLPPEMIGFYKENIEFVTEHAIDPDKRRYAFEEEAPRHYIDLDHYGEYPFDFFPRDWDSAVAKYSEDTIITYGIVPWWVQTMMHRLTKAFEQKDKKRILQLSADLGHYLGDSHVPLHTTKNYNGQLTGQRGIHGFWESRQPELYGEDYNYFLGKARYLEDPADFIWNVIMSSHVAVDSVLDFERKLTAKFPTDRKYSFEKKGQQTIRVYSEEFSAAYHDMMRGMIERRMRLAILSVGSAWYTCWVNAGQPDLRDIYENVPSEEEEETLKKIEAAYQNGKIQGREHNNQGTDGID